MADFTEIPPDLLPDVGRLLAQILAGVFDGRTVEEMMSEFRQTPWSEQIPIVQIVDDLIEEASQPLSWGGTCPPFPQRHCL